MALAPLFYWRLLIDRSADAATLPPGDITELHYPYRRWVAEQFARGDNAWWNPYVGAGHSAIGDVQFHLLYPPDALLARYFGGDFPLRALEIGIVAHVALGALFMYLLGRRLTRSRVGGLVAAIVFAFGGYLAGFPIQQMILLETSVWLPAVLLCVDLGAELGSLIPFVVGAGAFGMAALAGHPQTFFYVVLATVVYLLFKAWNGGLVRPIALLGLPILVLGGVGLAAGALLPAYFHLGLTDRTDVSYAFSSTGFGLRELLGIVFPLGFGGTPLYNGVFTLLLAATGLAAPYQRREKRFWLGFGLAGLLVSFGGNTFLESIQYLALGGLKFRDHERLAFYVGVAAAILAGYGAAELARGRILPVRWLGAALRWPAIILIGFTGFVLVSYVTATKSSSSLLDLADRAGFTLLVLVLGWGILAASQRRLLRPGSAALLAAALIAFDLFTTNWQTNLKPGDPAQLLSPSPIVTYLEDYSTGLFRISSEGRLPGDGNAGMLYRLDDLVVNSPLETRDYAEFEKAVPEWTRWLVLNVRYAITTRALDDPRFRLVMRDGSANLYEIDPKQRLPRAWVVQDVVAAPDHQLALKLMNSVDPRNVAVVEGPPAAFASVVPSPTPAATPVARPTPAPSQSPLQISGDESTGLTVDLKLEQPALLLVSDVDYPGWNATLDGAPTPIYRADGIIRGVVVPVGPHQVRFAFVPPGLALGQAVSAESLLLLRDLVILDLAAQVLWFAGKRLIRPRPGSGQRRKR